MNPYAVDFYKHGDMFIVLYHVLCTYFVQLVCCFDNGSMLAVPNA